MRMVRVLAALPASVHPSEVTDIEAWIPMGDLPDYDRYWSEFGERFTFRPSVSPEVRPGIREPRDSVTLSLTPIFGGPRSTFAAGEAAVGAEALRAFVAVFKAAERLVVLDWQHQGYWFRPHVHAVSENVWPVHPFPNGDYYIFLTEDMTAGTFGHPWEQSLCIFGEALVNQLAPALATWLPILRRGGEPAEEGSSQPPRSS